MDVRLLWLHAFVLWLEHEPVLDEESQEQIRAALNASRSRAALLVDRGDGDHGSPRGTKPAGSGPR
jgi:hypothetical protein